MVRLAETTEFNGKELLAGPPSRGMTSAYNHTTSFDTIQIAFGGIDLTALGISSTSTGGTDATTSGHFVVDAASFNTINTQRADFGAAQNRVEVSVANTHDSHQPLGCQQSNP